ncbi:hypothetical protein GCM10009554_24750 [Kribbella koreensis]|uniref:Uncharacterized protein n=1 Tax=Kribbella koreensis TaxID=57909 RepID=A0ABN1Q3J1_9ACTN
MADTDDDDLEQVHEDAELDAREERELREARLRRDVAAEHDAEVTDAMRRADVAEGNHRRLRAQAADERLLGRSDSAHAARLRADAASRDDATDLRAADRAQARSDSRYRAAVDDDRRADWNYAEGRAERSRSEQAPAAEAVRNAPEEPPVARKNVKPVRRRMKDKEQDPKALRHFGLGD